LIHWIIDHHSELLKDELFNNVITSAASLVRSKLPPTQEEHKEATEAPIQLFIRAPIEALLPPLLGKTRWIPLSPYLLLGLYFFFRH
jgi:hypothetical protein